MSSTGNRYKIAICQDGKFAITFDTERLRIKILENTDHRSFNDSSKKYSKIEADNTNDEINKTIAHFKIKKDLTIKEFYDTEIGIKSDGALNNGPSSSPSTTKGDEKFRWSFDISNLRKREDCHGMITHLVDGAHGGKPPGNSDNECFIFVAVSCINVDSDMRKEKNKNNKTNSDYEKGYLKEMKHNIDVVNINEVSEDETHRETIVDIDGASENKGTSISESEMRKGTAIYCLKLEKKSNESNEEIDGYVLSASEDVGCFYSDSVSGICKFVEADKFENSVVQERFVILNFHGIYNFEFNYSNEKFEKFTTPFTAQGTRINLKEKFEYPKSIGRELNNWYTKDDDTNTESEDTNAKGEDTNAEGEDTERNCMRRLRSCIYDKYFLVTQYKNNVQSLEVYNLAKMELETTAKKVENKNKFVRRYSPDTFSIGRLQLCFTRGINRVRLYCKESGLQVATKYFDEIERIHLLEFFDSDEKILIIGRDSKEELKFIIWDLYNTDKIIPITLDKCSIEDLDQTLGNILHDDNKGNVTSVLKKIENKLKKQGKELKPDRDAESIKNSKHKIYYDKSATPNFNEDEKLISNFNKIADWIEPWVLGCEKTSYCLYYNEGTETEFLQLIVGRSTVQIWHKIYDDDKKKDELPNKGDPFLEYIWTNGIPVDQERKETRLRINNFKYRSNDVNDESNDKRDYKLNDFSLEVYWYIRKHEKKDKKVDQDRKTDKDKVITNENGEIL